jgi:two-component system, LuxR family, response regulator FixJ
MRASYCNLATVDDHAVCKSLAFLLTLTGNQVADDALADAFLQRGDLNRVSGLILDHRMAHVTGLELAAGCRLPATGWGWQLPVLLVTGVPSPAIAARAAELGITNVLEKPSGEADIMAFIDGLGGGVVNQRA